VYSLRKDVNLHEGSTIPESPLAPKRWAARALLVDEPRGEPEYLVETMIAKELVKLWWLVPIHGAERELVLSKGLTAFDEAYSKSNWSLVDPGRPSIA
jgi:hypothetical protein